MAEGRAFRSEPLGERLREPCDPRRPWARRDGDIPHPTVLNPWAPTDHPAARSGDVGGPHEIPVAAEAAGRTAEDPPPGLGDPPAAEQAGRGGPPLVDLDHC